MKILLRDRIKAWRGEFFLSTVALFGLLCVPCGLRRLHWGLLIRLLKKTDLFDRDYYLDSNADVAQTGMPPLRHYVAYGDREGRCPMPLFDPSYYRSRAKARRVLVNALLHYAYVGRYLCISPSPWFDLRYYLSHNKDVARSRHEPIRHYLLWGGLEGRSPNPQFDGSFYLRTNPEVREADLNPLIHYLQVGRFSDRATRELNHVDQPEIQARQVDFLDGRQLSATNPTRIDEPNARVDVILPIYRDRDISLRCIKSLLSAKNDTPFELIVINDCSPDSDLADVLHRLSAQRILKLHHNEVNRGYVWTVNRGMMMHERRDVVLLNADTEVYHNWLDRLRSAAYRHVRTATVTPLSNNAGICSYPRFLQDNPYPLETSYDKLDAMTARVNAGVEIETPTGIGFCMYLRRDALKELGLFDQLAFGKGYGEDHDYCQLAIKNGWRNVIAADVFVRHIGGVSFLGERAGRLANAAKLLHRRHPGYHQNLDAFIRQDPLASVRRRLDWERFKATVRDENVLITCHNRGGGAERHVQEDTRRLQAEGKGVFYLRPERGRRTHARFGHPDCRQLLNLPTYELANFGLIAEKLRELRINCIHSHGLVDFTAKAPEHLLAIAKAIGASLQVDIHDYKVICPRLNLVDRNGRYCGEPEPRLCDQCLVSEGNEFDVRDIRAWRERHRRVLQAAEKIWVPSSDVAARLSRYYPELHFEILPHEDLDPSQVVIREPRLASAESLRVVVIGAISKIKGYEVLHACARDAQKRHLPIDYILMGYSYNDSSLRRAGVQVTGRYIDQEAEGKLHGLSPHVIWLPYTWPETYSYTLSLALKGGYPVFSFDLGAISERLRKIGRSCIVCPVSLACDPSEINSLFIQYRISHWHRSDLP